MKRILFIFGWLAVMLNPAVYAQSYDGNDWKLLNRYIEGRTMRKVLVRGICDGAEVMQSEHAREVYSIGNDEQLALMVDGFYNEEKNLSIPVTHALYIVSM